MLNNEELDDEAKDKLILSLTNECESLLKSIKILDNEFDIDNLKVNYKEIIIKIKESMEQIFYELSYNFKNAYLDMLIEEFSNDNNSVILNLINETNEKNIIINP